MGAQAVLLVLGAACVVVGATAFSWAAGVLAVGALLLLAGVDIGR